MMKDREQIVEAFVNLRKTMARFPGDVSRRAVDENPWFTVEGISAAAYAIAGQMLDPEKLDRWISAYSRAKDPKNVMVIMAGNIPMAGFFDLLCVLASGHRCVVKYSSKDRVLMEFITGELKRISPGIPIAALNESTPFDAVIASGSDNAIRHLKSAYAPIPALYRGNRASAAILTGNETGRMLNGLAEDIFSYSGLGCRNVSHLLLPRGYDPGNLVSILSGYPIEKINRKYINNFRQQKALLMVTGEEFIAGRFFVMVESTEFPSAVSMVTYSYYTTPYEAAEWVLLRQNQIQCVVATGTLESFLPFQPVPFGQAQSPSLLDFPDRVDTMRFLLSL